MAAGEQRNDAHARILVRLGERCRGQMARKFCERPLENTDRPAEKASAEPQVTDPGAAVYAMIA